MLAFLCLYVAEANAQELSIEERLAQMEQKFQDEFFRKAILVSE